jgi:hypothetical protein
MQKLQERKERAERSLSDLPIQKRKKGHRTSQWGTFSFGKMSSFSPRRLKNGWENTDQNFTMSHGDYDLGTKGNTSDVDLIYRGGGVRFRRLGFQQWQSTSACFWSVDLDRSNGKLTLVGCVSSETDFSGLCGPIPVRVGKFMAIYFLLNDWGFAFG